MIETATPLGFFPAGSVGAVHCVSAMTPNFQGSAEADPAPTSKPVIKTNRALKPKILFIFPSPFRILKEDISIFKISGPSYSLMADWSRFDFKDL